MLVPVSCSRLSHRSKEEHVDERASYVKYSLGEKKKVPNSVFQQCPAVTVSVYFLFDGRWRQRKNETTFVVVNHVPLGVDSFFFAA